MKQDYTQEYIEVLEDAMTLLNQKQAYMNKLINKTEGYDRETYLSNVTKLNELIKQKRDRLEELKKLRQS